VSAPRPRVVVAVDASWPSLEAVEEAVELAAQQGLELVGLFVEDLDLVRLACLPLAHETNSMTAHTRRLELPALEQQLRAQAERARVGFERVLRGRPVSASFRVARGSVSAEILAAVSAHDLVVGGCSGFGGTAGGKLGRTALELVEQFEGTLLLTPRPTAATGVARIDTGSAAGRRALRLGPIAGSTAAAGDSGGRREDEVPPRRQRSRAAEGGAEEGGQDDLSES